MHHSHKTRAILSTTVLALSLATAVTVSHSSPASAATGYSISSGTWNVHSCPATCTPVDSISAGPIPNLVCQLPGPAVSVPGFGTSGIYDMIRTPRGTLGYVSDLGVLQTRYAAFTPGLPRCDASGVQELTVAPVAQGAGYSWIFTCAYKVLVQKQLWSCWVAAGKYLLTP
jgi:hypothetical protein